MLHRQSDRGIYVISQPAHSWVSGQLARAWGNAQFDQPSEPVILAAALHDVGFLDWEANPTLNPDTGWPHTFRDLPTALHLHLWEKGIQQMLTVNRYATLLVSLHYTGLTERHPADSQEDRNLQTAFLKQQHDLQTSLISTLPNRTALDHDRPFIPLWDWMSLVLGMRESATTKIDGVSARDRNVQLLMHEYSPGKVRLSPWPFRDSVVQVAFESRYLAEKSDDEASMRQALKTAPAQTIHIELTPP